MNQKEVVPFGKEYKVGVCVCVVGSSLFTPTHFLSLFSVLQGDPPQTPKVKDKGFFAKERREEGLFILFVFCLFIYLFIFSLVVINDDDCVADR